MPAKANGPCFPRTIHGLRFHIRPAKGARSSRRIRPRGRSQARSEAGALVESSFPGAKDKFRAEFEDLHPSAGSHDADLICSASQSLNLAFLTTDDESLTSAN